MGEKSQIDLLTHVTRALSINSFIGSDAMLVLTVGFYTKKSLSTLTSYHYTPLSATLSLDNISQSNIHNLAVEQLFKNHFHIFINSSSGRRRALLLAKGRLTLTDLAERASTPLNGGKMSYGL